MDISHWGIQSALDPPLNGITTPSVSLLNAKRLSQLQIFRVWGSKEAGGAALQSNRFIPFSPSSSFCLVVSLQLLICLILLQLERSSVTACNIQIFCPQSVQCFNFSKGSSQTDCVSRSGCLVLCFEGFPVHSQVGVSKTRTD